MRRYDLFLFPSLNPNFHVPTKRGIVYTVLSFHLVPESLRYGHPLAAGEPICEASTY